MAARKDYEPTLSDLLDVMNTGFTRIDERFDRIEARMDRFEIEMAEIQENRTILENAVDKDAEILVNHEDRIKSLEKRFIQKRLKDR